MIIDRTIPLTTAQSIFLMVLKGSERPLSGTEIVESVKNTLGENSVPTPGAVYKILKFLRDNEYIEEKSSVKPKKKDGTKDGRIHPYALTQRGENIVVTVFSHISRIFSFMCNCCVVEQVDIPTLTMLMPGQYQKLKS
ncbi:MAG: PadR family transcriptional regulator [Candidatus Heimdallarchaeota archaeon]|nr:PadR family transcriptional regulator [Candidatus Heimdallarchaeota archaeon]